MMHGIFCATAISMARVIFSPAAAPIAPPQNLKSITATETSMAWILPTPTDHGLRQAAVFFIALDAVGIALRVDELQRVARPHGRIGLGKRALVEKFRDARARADREMVATFRRDHLVVLNLLVEDDFARNGILRVDTLGDVFLLRFADRVSGFVEMHGGVFILTVAEGDDVEVQRAGPPQRACAAVERGAGRENVINEDVVLVGI